MFTELEKYLENWFNLQGIKPKNEPEFIKNFIKFISLENFENLQFYFDGDGSYFGKQISIQMYGFRTNPTLMFEICYSPNKISVYNGNHNGFWTPEYIELEKGNGNFSELQTKITKLLIYFLGISHLISA